MRKSWPSSVLPMIGTGLDVAQDQHVFGLAHGESGSVRALGLAERGAPTGERRLSPWLATTESYSVCVTVSTEWERLKSRSKWGNSGCAGRIPVPTGPWASGS